MSCKSSENNLFYATNIYGGGTDKVKNYKAHL